MRDPCKGQGRWLNSPTRLQIYAGMAKLADALDLGSSAARRGGSSPSTRTKICEKRFVVANDKPETLRQTVFVNTH
jgi:hypothetical protein